METKQAWEKIKELFGAALERDTEERAAFLQAACGGDESLRQEVESLIKAHKTGSTLWQPSLQLPSADAAEGRFIGSYQLIKKIGEGGMGQVWLAQQTSPLQRQVALKLVRWGMYDTTLLHRFQAERQSLALMDHPAIARVFDAGATAEAQPYFVMEYVAGVPITDYCDQKRLKIPDRLELFIKVCEGVQHAHQKAIIHRDLKPANILVVELDGHPVPRIIDFGLAKAMNVNIGGESLHTHAGSFVGTPGYMSPEQCDPSTEDVDTRTDVYSLGVVLYVLLTGGLPIDAAEWRKKPFDEMLRYVREQDPPLPSTKVSSDGETSTATAAARGAELKQLISTLRGDLDWITMKAVEKDRSRRYGTPSDLAADISRYLNSQPITARPASLSYRASKFVRRNRTAVALATFVAIAVIAGVTGTLMQARTARRERDSALRERDRASRVTDFMTGMFKVSDPTEAVGNGVTAREILDKASKDINTGLTQDPELEAQMMQVMGNVYANLGLYERAQTLLERAIRISQATGGPADPVALISMSSLGGVLYQLGRAHDGEKLQREALRLQLQVLGPEHPDTMETQSNLGSNLAEEGKLEEGEKLQREALQKQRRLLGADDRHTIAKMDDLAVTLGLMGRYSESEQLENETITRERRAYGPDHLGVLNSMTNQGDNLYNLGRYAEAQAMWQQTLDTELRVLGANHPATATVTYDLGCLAALTGRREEAFILLDRAMDHLSPRLVPNVRDDPTFNVLHGDPRFAGLVKRAEQHHPTDNKCPL